MSSTEPQDDALAEMEKNKTNLSTSCNSKANPDLESSSNTTTKDITCSSLYPPVITTDISQTELILDSNKSNNLDKEGNLNKQKNTGDGDNTPIRCITPSDLSPKDSNSESPDFNIFKKTVNLFDLPHSFTRTSPTATDSSELMEEDMVLKWDDDDEELEKIEGKSEEPDNNANIEDIVENKTAVINKLNDSEKLSYLENKVVDTTADITTINACSIKIKNPEKLSTGSKIAKCIVVDQENDEEIKTKINKNIPVDNSFTNLEKKIIEKVSESKSVIKEKVDSNDQNQINLSDSTKIESASEESFGVDHEEVEENSEMDVQKDTFSTDNVIRSLDQMINDKVTEEKLLNEEHIHSSLDTKNVDTKTDQKQTDSAEVETVTEKPLSDVVHVGNKKGFSMDIDKVATSVDNIITNLTQVINDEIAEDKLLTEENVDLSLDTENIDTKTDQKLTVFTKAETDTEKPSSNVQNVGYKEDTSMDVDKVTTSFDNIITNLAQVTNDKTAEDKPLNEENRSLETEKIYTKSDLKITDSVEAETVIEKPLSDVVNVGNKEDIPMDVDKVDTSIDNINTNMAQIIDDKTAKENVCLPLDSKNDQIQADFKDSASKHITEKPFSEAVNVVKISNKDHSQIDIDEITTPIDNFNTNLDQITDEKVTKNEISENNVVLSLDIKTVVSSLDIKTDQELVDFSDPVIAKSGTESTFTQAENEGNKGDEKQTQIDIDKVTTSIDNIITNLGQTINKNEEKPITTDNEGSFCKINTDLNQVKNKIDKDSSVKTVSEKKVVKETSTKTIAKSIDLNTPSKLQKMVSPTQEENRPLEESSNIYSQDSAISDVTEEKCADIIIPAKSISKPENSSESDMSTSESFLDATLEEKEHNLIEPNMMIEIPSQNIIDFTNDVDNDSQKKENIPQKTSDKFEFLKIDSKIKDSKIQDLDKNLEKIAYQISSESKTELSVGVKEMDSDKIVTEVTNQIDSKQSIKEVSSTNKNDSVETQDKTEPLTDLIEHLRTTDQMDKDEPKASSSQMDPDMSDEVPEVTDSLGLLAESSRVMEDDEEQETSDHDEGDDEEDFDPDDEGSNEMTAELSEDSNPQESGSDIPKDKPITQADVHTELDIETDNAQDIIEKIVENDDIAEMETEDIQFESMAEAEVAVKEGDLDIEEDMVIDEVDIADAPVDSADLPNQAMDALESAIIEAAEELEKVESVDEPAKQPVIETVKLSDTSDAEEDAPKKESYSLLKTLLAPSREGQPTTASETLSPTKAKKLEISKPKLTLNFVDLEESSSEDVSPADVQEVPKDQVDDVTTVNIPSEIEIMSVGGNTSDIVSKDKEIVISGVPKPPPGKPARLNTSEVTIKTTPANEPAPALVIPEVGEKDKSKCGLEVYSLDSDEEEAPPVIAPVPSPEKPTEQELPKPPEKRFHKCINDLCTSDSSVPHFPAPRPAVAMYAPHHTKKAQICERCAQAVVERSDRLVSDIRSFAPLLHLDMGRHRQELVEISDSDSEDEVEEEEEEKVTIGEKGAAMLDDLTDMINESWLKFRMDARLKEAEDAIKIEQDLQEKELKELGAMLDECQAATDKLRTELYLTFEPEKKELPALVVFDTPDNMYSFVMPPSVDSDIEKTTSGQYKRRHSSVADTPNKKIAVSSKNLSIPLGFTPLEAPKSDATAQGLKAGASTAPVAAGPDDKNDDDKDISVVRQSVESAPASLPPHGEPARPKVHVGMQVYAMRNAFGTWLKAKVVECTPKGTAPSAAQFSQCRVKFESSTHKNAFKTLPARCLAYSEPSEVRMTIGTRIIALYKDMETKREAYYSGLVAEVPNPVNSYRYLVFFDDGYTQYVQHADTRLVCEFSALVWDEVHPFSREFVRQYLLSYPERPMVRLHTGQSLKTELDGKWWSCKVLQVDASLVHVHFENYKNNKSEWIYRGSTRLAPLYLELQAAERQRARPLPRNRLANQTNMPYVEYTRSDEQTSPEKPPENIHSQIQAQEELRRQRAVAKKSTSMPPSQPQPQPQPQQQTPTVQSVGEGVTSRVVYYTPKNAVKPYKMRAHACSPQCKRNDVLSLKELRTYNPLARPLLSGWERQLVRFKGHKEVMYRAPCGRRLRDIKELHRYLRTTRSEMSVDLFDFAVSTHCLAEFVLNKCIVSKKDLSNGKENVPVPCVNYYDDSLPEFCSYNTERTPTEGVPLNLDPDFLCGCDCTDDCEDKTKCACWKLTLEGARTIGIDDDDVGYVYRRLPEPLNSGIYECNSRCKCKQTCLNRVAQHPLQLKLQVFKTINRGWGIRALNDVPKGAFLCVYAGNLLTDATANLDGLNEGDEYLAELDYIEVVEQMKEGYEEDIPEADKRLDRKESGQASSSEHSSSEDEGHTRNEQNDGDFQPSYIGPGVQDYRNRLRKRNRNKMKGKDAPPAAEKNKEVANEECITISDDEELREPARFAAQPGMGGEFISKYRSVRSHFGKDEACYIMDAKVQGNIGRYLNHSCTPNVFVQNVFVDTHDPRFPWVAFFALKAVRAGTELTWNYNYDVGSVPGKVLYCYCGATNCRGRLL